MCCPPSPLKRVHYFQGQLLRVDDLQAEQEYLQERLRRHNRCFHGWGVVCGLELSVTGSRVVITPGLALDCMGNEVVLSELLSLDLPTSASAGVAQYVVLSYSEDFADPAPGDQESEGGLSCSRILESYRHALLPEDPLGGHVRRKGRWLACGSAHGVPLGRLRRTRGGWRLDPRYRGRQAAQ